MVTRSKNRADESGFGAIGIIALIIVLLVLVVIVSVVRIHGGKVGLSNGCKDTNLTLQPVTVTDLKDPLTLQAKVTMGSAPVANEDVTFRSVGHDKNGHQIADIIGRTKTDAQGIATYKNNAGIADQSITFGVGGVMTGVKAEFDGNGVTDRTKNPDIPFYCGSNATMNLAKPLTIQKVEI